MNTLLLLTVKKNRGWLGLAHSNEFISLQSARRIFVKEYNNAISIHRPKGMAKDMEERSAKLVDLAEIRWLRITRHVTDTFDLFLFTCGKVSPYFFYILCVYVCGCRPHSIPHSLFHLDWSTPLCRTLLPLFKCDHNIQNFLLFLPSSTNSTLFLWFDCSSSIRLIIYVDWIMAKWRLVMAISSCFESVKGGSCSSRIWGSVVVTGTGTIPVWQKR